MRNVILVLGMHRSGTSAAAGFLVKLGGAQPKTLMPAEGGNERGYFESQALMTFHNELLASAGSSWTDWRQFNPAWYQSSAAAAFRKRAKLLFEDEFDGEPLAVLKDPRVCRFVPFWLEVLASIKARASVVIPVRAPLEVAFSMRKRYGFSLATGALLWLRHITDAEIATRALPCSIIPWDQLLRDWRGVAEKASTELGIPWPRLSDATAHEIETFLDHDLIHHRVSAPEHAAHPDIHEWTMSAYASMLELAREPQSSSALKTLDKTRDAFNRASRMFGRIVLDGELRGKDPRRTTAILENKFERRFPSHQNAIDIFGDHWASKVEEVYPGLTSGPGPYFNEDRRPSIAAQYLGFEPGSLQGMNILELGPLEGAHTYQLAKLGADRILAIETNAEAFLKCLVVKEILRTRRCRFLLGDCLKFLQESHDQFDMIFCSGVLDHMENPFELIKAISRHTDRVFLWTHYYDPDIPLEPARSPTAMVCDGLELTFYKQSYGDTNYGRFWGGNTSTASWLSRDSIKQCFQHFGYDLSVREDNRVAQAGPHIIATALR